jgi:uncharacterized protein
LLASAYLSSMRSHNARVAVLLYSLVTAVALALGFVRGNPDLYHHPRPFFELPFWIGLPTGIVTGVVIGSVVVWFSQRAVTTWRWERAVTLHNGLRQIFGSAENPFHSSDILALALSSAIGEELLFRGWLEPLAGLILSSVLFGLLHYAPRASGMWVWIPYAIIMGIAFGASYRLTGNIMAPIVAHFVINYRNLHFINTYDPAVIPIPPDPLSESK